MYMKSVDVIIPVYKPGEEFCKVLKRLQKQHYPVEKIRIMNTEEEFWNQEWEKEFPNMEVHHITKKEFDHGGTRKLAAALSDADILLFMTQDALPANRNLIGELVKALEQEDSIAAAYARQLPKKDCGFLERYTRNYNYPENASVKWKKDLKTYGIKTYFCSNVCAAYKREIYEKNGGFVTRTIFNEDMIFASVLIQAGYGIAYAADAKVLHSHNYSPLQNFHRNFDLGVSQAEYAEVFSGISSEGEGISLVKKSFHYLIMNGRLDLLFSLIIQSGYKYAGYLAGKNYQKLPKKWIQSFTMMPEYWKKE